jgi:hypothetical protein
LTAKPDEIATKAGTENHKKDRQSTAEAGELSASGEQALIRQVQVCIPRSKKGGGTCTSELNKTASLGIQARLSGSY